MSSPISFSYRMFLAFVLSLSMAFVSMEAFAAPRLKKDGTPDMRFKENREAARTQAPRSEPRSQPRSEPREVTRPSGPLKKDGTPDMR